MDFLDELAGSVLCGDGAMGTELMSAGVPVDVCFEELTISSPDSVARIHEAYVQAGARLIETNTFGANAARLARHGLETRVKELNQAAVRLARGVIGSRPVYLAGSIGPSGVVIHEPGGDPFDPLQLFREQSEAILEAGVDVIFLETFLDFNEIQIALDAVRRTDPKIPVICSMVSSEEGRLPSSLPVVQAFRELTRLGADLVGVNCVTGPYAMLQILRRIPADFLISAFPNAGYPRYHDGRFLYNLSPVYFGQAAKEFVEHGARLVGGCCGVGPEHIHAMSKAIAGLKPIRSKPAIQWISELELKPRKKPTETSILDLMARGQTVVVTELDPPKTLDLDKYFAAARTLIDAGSDAITLADNSLAILRVSNLAVGAILKQQYNIMPLLHVSCRDKNLIGLQSELMGIAALGIRHVLPLTGDPAKFGDHPGSSSVYDVNSIQLMEIISGLNKGYNFAGKSLKYPTDFVIGCTFNPNAKNFDAQISRLERKIAAGARYVMTQPVFDKALVQKMHERTRLFGVPVLTGVWPLLSGKQTEFLHNEVPGIIVPDDIRARMAKSEGLEARRMGVQIAKDVVRAALDCFPGIYLITPFLAYDTTAELANFARNLS
jgi:methionine synthase / methylenetetrahydrofolate reductase (NADH)